MAQSLHTELDMGGEEIIRDIMIHQRLKTKHSKNLHAIDNSIYVSRTNPTTKK